MKERPILFSAPMVRAILDGSKTQTRRLCKPANEAALSAVVGPFDCPELGHGHFGDEEGDLQFLCPYGQPGDRLWVRETFAEIGARLTYKADTDDGAHCMVKRWIPSIHMPRIDSRILLEIVSVRVERLQDISDQDAMAEGVDAAAYGKSHRYGYSRLWEEINGAGGWAANPWVWVVEFKRVQP